jgi:hypothetical protein
MSNKMYGHRADRIMIFKDKIMTLCSILHKLDLASDSELQDIYSYGPKEIFSRFMMARVKNVQDNNRVG